MNQIPPKTSRWTAGSNPNMFETIKRSSLDYLMGVFARVMSRADDWLFDLVQEKGPLEGADQLDALRALRIARGPMERDFRRHFETSFDSLNNPAAYSGIASRLSILRDDQMEVQLASEMVVEKVILSHGPALDALDKRLASMAGVAQLDPNSNPLSAATIANALQVALQEVKLPSDTRVMLLKFYERELEATLDRLLGDLNARLIAAGFLPHLGNPLRVDTGIASNAGAANAVGATPVMNAAPSAVSSSYAGGAIGGAGVGGDGGVSHAAYTPKAPVAEGSEDDREVFDELVEMLHAWRPQQADAPAMPSTDGLKAAAASLLAARAMQPNEMFSVLSLMQNQVPDSVRSAMGNPDAKLSLLLKQELLRGASTMGLDPQQVHISPEDEDAVDLVGMIFDVMFDERDFENNARDLMARCVVPYVKAAVLDRHMFVHKTHPARKLLNSLAEACEGNRGEGAQEREVLTKAESVVDRLVAEFNEDIAIFNLLEQELREYLEQYRRRVEISEKRAAEAQRGQERLEQARDISNKELNKRVENRLLPAALSDFMINNWTHHLSLIALRDGVGSTQWNAAIAIADSLLAMVPKEGAKSHSVASTIHGIREPIETVLASSGITGDAAGDVIKQIIAQMDLLSAGTLESDAKRTGEFPVLTPHTKTSDARPNLLAVAVDNTEFNYSADDLNAVKRLKVGAWVHLSSDDDKLHPAKLSWISPITSRLMFVNRRGVRVLVASAEELAHLKHQGRLQIREQENVFDQVIHRVMGKLRSERRPG
jgi:hypothetical protein